MKFYHHAECMASNTVATIDEAAFLCEEFIMIPLVYVMLIIL